MFIARYAHDFFPAPAGAAWRVMYLMNDAIHALQCRS